MFEIVKELINHEFGFPITTEIAMLQTLPAAMKLGCTPSHHDGHALGAESGRRFRSRRLT